MGQDSFMISTLASFEAHHETSDDTAGSKERTRETQRTRY